jgi:hypothetical protein
MHSDAERATGTRFDDDLRAVDALVEHADADQIWRVLDYARRQSVPLVQAYRAIIGDLPAESTG